MDLLDYRVGGWVWASGSADGWVGGWRSRWSWIRRGVVGWSGGGAGVEWVREVGWGERRIDEMDAGDGELRERGKSRQDIHNYSSGTREHQIAIIILLRSEK